MKDKEYLILTKFFCDPQLWFEKEIDLDFLNLSNKKIIIIINKKER